MSLRALLLNPLPNLPWEVAHIHLDQLTLIAMPIDTLPAARVQLLVIEHLQLRRESFEIGIEVGELVNLSAVGRPCGTGLCVG